MRPGVVFVPIHYGYWDMPDADVPEAARTRAANELTHSEIDPVSEQPLFKTAAAQVRRVGGPSGARASHHGLSPDADAATRDVPATDW